jgi:hypothetical protein
MSIYCPLSFPELAMIQLIALVSLVVVVWPAARICRRAGYSPYLGFVAIVPILNLALLWFIAFSPWNANRR